MRQFFCRKGLKFGKGDVIMGLKKKRAERPSTQRKEAKNTMPANAVHADAIPQKETKGALIKLIAHFAQGKSSRAGEQTAPRQRDALLRDDMSEFERSLILECREDGMGDDEIRAWLKEL